MHYKIMKSLIEKFEGIKITPIAIVLLSTILVGCKNTNVLMPNRGGGEVHPLGVDFADPVDVVEEVKPKTKNIPTMNYTVVKGDSLWKISRDYKTTVATLSELNGISGSLIREGQVILVPSANAPEKVVEEPVAEPEEPILEEPTPDPVDSAVEENEVKEEIPIIPAPINEDDLLPVPEAP